MPKLKDIPDKTRNELQQGIDEAMQSLECETDGINITWLNIFRFEFPVFLLSRLLEDYFPAMSERQMYTQVREALYYLACLNPEERTVDKLIEKLSDNLRVGGITTFQIVVFLNALPPSDEVTVNDVTFYPIKGTALRPLISEERRRVNPNAYNSLNNFTAYFYEVTVPAYRVASGVHDVIDELILPFEQMRALLNFNHHWGLYSFRLGREYVPRAQYPPTPYIFVRQVGNSEKEEFDFFYIPVVAIQYRNRRIESNEWQRFLSLEDRLFRPTPQQEKSTKRYVARLLLIYQQALDSPDQATAFLHFWQVLERIASPRQEGRGIETKKIISRLDTIVPLNQREKMVLKELGKIRHAYVHQGNFSHSQGEQLGILIKPYVDRCLSGLYGLLNELPTLTDLEEYFSVAGNPSEARLQALENAIRIVRSRRGR